MVDWWIQRAKKMPLVANGYEKARAHVHGKAKARR